MFQKILVAMDQSSLSQSVFEKAIDLAKTNQASLMLLHVLSPNGESFPMPLYPGIDGIYPLAHDAIIRTSLEEYSLVEDIGLEFLQSHERTATAAGITTEVMQNMGDAGPTICTIATTWNADLIVMGRRGRTGLAELVLGSVSNHVLHHAPCSVLVIQEALVPA
jgi:nucleotide-binding universal stress UspA family protein